MAQLKITLGDNIHQTLIEVDSLAVGYIQYVKLNISINPQVYEIEVGFPDLNKLAFSPYSVKAIRENIALISTFPQVKINYI